MALAKVSKVLLLIVIISLPVYFGGRWLVSQRKPAITQAIASVNPVSKVTPGPLASIPVNYDFDYSLSTVKGKDGTIPSLKFTVQNAEKRNQIVVQGKTATAVDGRVFLILNLKVTNPNEKGVQISTRDFFRLSVNGNQAEWLAPDIHNDPVEVQAISTKYTRVGFPINTNDTGLVLQVGQVTGEKHQIPLGL
jgi:hypothetical protein